MKSLRNCPKCDEEWEYLSVSVFRPDDIDKNFCLIGGYWSDYDNTILIFTKKYHSEEEFLVDHPYIITFDGNGTDICDDCVSDMIVNREVEWDKSLNVIPPRPIYVDCCGKLEKNRKCDVRMILENKCFPYASYFELVNNGLIKCYIKNEEYNFKNNDLICSDCFENKLKPFTQTKSEHESFRSFLGRIGNHNAYTYYDRTDDFPDIYKHMNAIQFHYGVTEMNIKKVSELTIMVHNSRMLHRNLGDEIRHYFARKNLKSIGQGLQINIPRDVINYILKFISKTVNRWRIRNLYTNNMFKDQIILETTSEDDQFLTAIIDKVKKEYREQRPIATKTRLMFKGIFK